MNRKWRILLSFSNVAIAVALFASREYRLWHRLYPSGPSGYMEMIETRMTTALDLPALIISAPIRNSLSGSLTRSLYYSDVVFFGAVFLFWWWVGTQIDHHVVGRGQRVKAIWAATKWERLMYVMMAIVALGLTVVGLVWMTPLGVYIRPVNEPPVNEFSISSVLWGLGLLIFSIAKVRTRALTSDHR